MQMIIAPDGNVTCLYTEMLDVRTLGVQTIRRASHIEPDRHGDWWVDLAPIGGCRLGPFKRRSEALTMESRLVDARLNSHTSTDRPTGAST